MASDHILKRFDEELERLNATINEMGGLTESQFAKALTAVRERDTHVAEEVIADAQASHGAQTDDVSGTLTGSGAGTVEVAGDVLQASGGALTFNFPAGMFDDLGVSGNRITGDTADPVVNDGVMTVSGGGGEEGMSIGGLGT